MISNFSLLCYHSLSLIASFYVFPGTLSNWYKNKQLVFLCVCVQACYGTCRHVTPSRCQSSRTPWLFWPIVSSYPTPTGTPPPITTTTASSTFIPPRCCAMLQAASGKCSTHTHKQIHSFLGQSCQCICTFSSSLSSLISLWFIRIQKHATLFSLSLLALSKTVYRSNCCGIDFLQLYSTSLYNLPWIHEASRCMLAPCVCACKSIIHAIIPTEIYRCESIFLWD